MTTTRLSYTPTMEDLNTWCVCGHVRYCHVQQPYPRCWAASTTQHGPRGGIVPCSCNTFRLAA